MDNEELVKELSEHLSSFVENNTDIDVAIKILALYSETTPNLPTLLTEYHNAMVVFISLTKTAQSPTTTALLAHLIEVNTNILHISLSNGGLLNNTLLQLFLNNNETYHGILDWLEINKPEILAAEKIKRAEIEQLYTLALAFLKKDSVKFQKLLSTLSIELIHQILATNNQNLLDKLIIPPLTELNFLVKLDYSILHIYYDETVFLSYLCDDSMIYLSTLTIIKETHAAILSKMELDELDDAFDVEKERVKRYKKKLQKSMTQLIDLNGLNPSIIQFSTLNALALQDSPFTLDNEQIKRFINTQLMIDNAVLDTYITQTFADNLMMKGIIVMPTIRKTEEISVDQIARIKAREPVTFISDIGIENNSIVARGMVEKIPGENTRFVIWPITNEQKIHYGLFILDLTNNKSYYIEPLRLENIFLSHKMEIKPLTTSPIDFAKLSEDKYYRQQTVGSVSPFLYHYYLQQLTKNLSLKQEDIRYIHLAQNHDVNYCSDYIIAILARLAAGEIDLISNPDSLLSLEANKLNEASVQVIRLLEIQRFKMDYFMFQLAERFKTSTFRLKQMISPKEIDPVYNSILAHSFFASSEKRSSNTVLLDEPTDQASEATRTSVVCLFASSPSKEIAPQKIKPKKEYVRSPLAITVKTAADLEEEQLRQQQQSQYSPCSSDDADDNIMKY